MTGSKRADSEDMHIVLHSLTSSLGRSLEQRAHVNIKATVGISCRHNLSATVVTVLTHLGNHDTGLTTFALGKFFTHFLSFLKIGIILGFAGIHA